MGRRARALRAEIGHLDSELGEADGYIKVLSDRLEWTERAWSVSTDAWREVEGHPAVQAVLESDEDLALFEAVMLALDKVSVRE